MNILACSHLYPWLIIFLVEILEADVFNQKVDGSLNFLVLKAKRSIESPAQT